MNADYFLRVARDNYWNGELVYIRCKEIHNHDLVFDKYTDGFDFYDVCDKIAGNILSVEKALFYTAVYVTADIFADLVYRYHNNYTPI